MSGSAAAPREFSRVVPISHLGEGETIYRLTAKAAERTALSQRLGLVALDRFEVDASLSREVAGGIRLAARIEAELVQECVVTLDPVPSRLDESFVLIYRRRPLAQSEIIDVGEEDIEPLEGDSIDIGEAAAQQLSLALDPFPRTPTAKLPEAGVPDSATAREMPPPTHPFAALARLAKK
jgi:uncharacterized metal-binding protein YceD (DUF177 family)